MQEVPTTPFHEIFEAQCQLYPNRVAVTFNNEKLTYKELNEKANQLAHYLLEQHKTKGSHVAVKLLPSLNSIIAILAIMKAGMVYIPIPADTDLSDNRLTQIKEDCNPVTIITDERIRALADYPKKENPKVEVHSTDLAYIFYSSGTTGKPKGVLIEHKGLYAAMQSHHEVMNITSGTYIEDSKEKQHCIAQFASLGFDASIMEIMVALGIGAKLCVVPAELRSRPDGLIKYYSENEVTVAIFTPSMMQELDPEILLSLKIVLGMGERLPQTVLDNWAKHKLFINGYGPTEVTIASSLGVLKPGNAVHAGKKIKGLRFFVVNRDENEEGELCIAGNGLARGYINNPELTNAKFVKLSDLDPTHPEPNLRVYRTGDLVKISKDGNLEIKGRIDRQVKIYGKLVQPEAIDEILQKQRGIAGSYTDVQFDEYGHPKITAYIILNKDNKPFDIDPLTMYEAVKSELSQTMAPTRFVFLDRIPLNKRNKLDTAELKNITSEQKFIRPVIMHTDKEDEIVDRLTKIMKRILGLEEIELCLGDNFFHLGGTSLLLMNLLVDIKKEFKIKVSINDFISMPTIGAVARKIRKAQKSTELISPIIDIASKADGKPPFMFFIHTLMCDVGEDYAKLNECLKGQYTVYGINPYGLQSKKYADETIEEAAANYINIMQKIQPHGPYFIAGWSLGGMIASEMARQLEARKERVSVLMIDTEAPQVMQEMNRQEFAAHLADLHSRLRSKFILKTQFDKNTLDGKSKEQQIDSVFQSLLSNADIEIRNRLWCMRCFLIAALNYHPKPTKLEFGLVAASATQEKQGKRLKWPTTIGIDIVKEIAGTHYTVFSHEHEPTIAAIKYFYELSVAKFDIVVLIEELRNRYIAKSINEPQANIADVPSNKLKLLTVGDKAFNEKLCSYLAHQWAMHMYHNTDLIIYLDAQRLTKDLYQQSKIRLEDIIQRQCVGDFGPSVDNEKLRHFISQFKTRIFFILQNYDPNIVDARCKEIIDGIINNHEIKVFVTSQKKLPYTFEEVRMQSGYTIEPDTNSAAPSISSSQLPAVNNTPAQSSATANLLSQFGLHRTEPLPAVMSNVNPKDAVLVAIDRGAVMEHVTTPGSAKVYSMPKETPPELLAALGPLLGPGK